LRQRHIERARNEAEPTERRFRKVHRDVLEAEWKADYVAESKPGKRPLAPSPQAAPPARRHPEAKSVVGVDELPGWLTGTGLVAAREEDQFLAVGSEPRLAATVSPNANTRLPQ
jgi:hypothetical protein